MVQVPLWVQGGLSQTATLPSQPSQLPAGRCRGFKHDPGVQPEGMVVAVSIRIPVDVESTAARSRVHPRHVVGGGGSRCCCHPPGCAARGLAHRGVALGGWGGSCPHTGSPLSPCTPSRDRDVPSAPTELSMGAGRSKRERQDMKNKRLYSKIRKPPPGEQLQPQLGAANTGESRAPCATATELLEQHRPSPAAWDTQSQGPCSSGSTLGASAAGHSAGCDAVPRKTP